jgi:DNA-damage-inducible protein J
MTTIEQTVVRARVATAVKDEAADILRGKGLTVSDLMRETLLRVIDTGDVPFPVRNPIGQVVDDSRSLAQVKYDAGMKMLPELHQSWWSQQLGQLMSDERKAEAAGDAKQLASVDKALRAHYKLRHDTAVTKARLEKRLKDELQEEKRERRPDAVIDSLDYSIELVDSAPERPHVKVPAAHTHRTKARSR